MDAQQKDSSQQRKIEELVAHAELCAAVMGAGAEFVLVPIDPGPWKEDARAPLELARARGYELCGVMGVYADGRTVARTQPGADPDATLAHIFTMAHAVNAFAQFVCTTKKAKKGGAEFRGRVYRMPQGPRNAKGEN